jgi:hypothetical protein
MSHVGNTTSAHFARHREASAGSGNGNSNSNSNSNSERVMSTAAELATFNAGVTKDGQAVFVEAGLLRGANNGVGVELLSAGLQVGNTSEANATLLRMTVQSDDQQTNVVLTTLGVTASNGERNPDGSANDNTTAQATLAGVELNQEFENGESLTIGLALSVGLPDVQVWSRDVDQDNDTEQCLRVSNGPVTVGGCIEPIVIARAARDLALEFWNQL